MWRTFGGRGGCDDAGYARDLRGDNAHVRRGDHRVAAARHVAADSADRDVAVAQHDARHRLDLEIAQALLLLHGEVAHLSLCEGDVVEVALAELSHGRVDLRRGEKEVVRVVSVELARQFAHRLVAAALHVGEDALDGGPHLVVGIPARLRILAALEPRGHVVFSPESSNRSRRTS